MCRVTDEVQPSLDQHTLVCDLPDQSLIIAGDEIRLEQVLQNLILNAIKYSPTGGQVLVRIEQQQNNAIVAVIDQGIGIPPDAIPMLFQRFYRAPNAIGASFGGLGVGLYVVKEIVTLHGGQVEVQSIEGQGSTFLIKLPLCHRVEQQTGSLK